MYPHHVFNLESAGTFGMYPICYWRVSGRYFQPEPAMYSRCFCWFPGPLAPSEGTFRWPEVFVWWTHSYSCSMSRKSGTLSGGSVQWWRKRFQRRIQGKRNHNRIVSGCRESIRWVVRWPVIPIKSCSCRLSWRKNLTKIGIKEKHNKDRHKGERWGKECEVKLGRKWMKNMSKNSVW